MRLLAKVSCAPDDFWPSCSLPKRQEPLTIDTVTPVLPTRGQSTSEAAVTRRRCNRQNIELSKCDKQFVLVELILNDSQI